MSEGTGVLQGSLGYPNAFVSSDMMLILDSAMFGEQALEEQLGFLMKERLVSQNKKTTVLCGIHKMAGDTKDSFFRTPSHHVRALLDGYLPLWTRAEL